MHTVYKTPAVTATTRPTRDLDADLLVHRGEVLELGSHILKLRRDRLLQIIEIGAKPVLPDALRHRRT